MPARTVSKLPPRAAKHETLQPPGWPAPKGYANGIKARGEFVFVGGMVGWDANEKFPEGFVAQTRQALANIVAVLAEGGAKPEHIVRLVIYVTDKFEYRERTREVGERYRKHLGKHFPAMVLVQVAGLLDDAAKVEIEGMAVLPA